MPLKPCLSRAWPEAPIPSGVMTQMALDGADLIFTIYTVVCLYGPRPSNIAAKFSGC